MKFFVLLILTTFFPLAHASYFATSCSNSSGSVLWESGQIANHIQFQYYSPRGQVIATLPMFQVTIDFKEKLTIKNEEIRKCGLISITQVYIGKILILPAPEYPDALNFLNSDNQVQTEVICTYRMNSMAPCPPDEDHPSF